MVSPAGRPPRRNPRTEDERRQRSREKLRKLLRDGKLDDREVDVEVQPQNYPPMDFMPQPPQGMEGPDINWSEWLQEMMPKRKKRRTVRVPEARRILVDEELRSMVDMDDVVNEALDRVENHGIIFIDEIDKIAGERSQTAGPTSPGRGSSGTSSRSSRAPRSRPATATSAPTTSCSSPPARSTSRSRRT